MLMSVIYPRKNGTETSKHLNAIYIDVLMNSNSNIPAHFVYSLRNEKRHLELSKLCAVLVRDCKKSSKHRVLWKLLLSRLPLAWAERLRTASTLKLLTNISWNKWSVNFSSSSREYAIFCRKRIWLLAGQRHEKTHTKFKENILGHYQEIKFASPWSVKSLSHHPFLTGWLANYKF